jgi:hypothetical protein
MLCGVNGSVDYNVTRVRSEVPFAQAVTAALTLNFRWEDDDAFNFSPDYVIGLDNFCIATLRSLQCGF